MDESTKTRFLNVKRFLVASLVYVGLICLAALIWQAFWAVSGMSEWTKLGPMPYGCALFVVIAFAAVING